MKVTLINYTQNAIDLLILTKSTRLNLSTDLIEEIKTWDESRKMDEIKYISETIPSSWEFVDYTFLVEGVSRAYTHQQVRTRHGSYAQQSMRVTDQGGFGFVVPNKIFNSEDGSYKLLNECIQKVKTTYQTLVQEFNIQPEDARSILPTNIATNIICKFNLRTFSELVKSRSGGRTQSEYRDVVRAMADEVLKVHRWAEPFLYPDGKNYFNEIEAFAEKHFGNDIRTKGELLKIIDRMRK